MRRPQIIPHAARDAFCAAFIDVAPAHVMSAPPVMQSYFRQRAHASSRGLRRHADAASAFLFSPRRALPPSPLCRATAMSRAAARSSRSPVLLPLRRRFRLAFHWLHFRFFIFSPSSHRLLRRLRGGMQQRSRLHCRRLFQEACFSSLFRRRRDFIAASPACLRHAAAFAARADARRSRR